MINSNNGRLYILGPLKRFFFHGPRQPRYNWVAMYVVFNKSMMIVFTVTCLKICKSLKRHKYIIYIYDSWHFDYRVSLSSYIHIIYRYSYIYKYIYSMLISVFTAVSRCLFHQILCGVSSETTPVSSLKEASRHTAG